MIFLTYWFWTFAAIVLPLYWLVPAPRVRLPLLVLMLASYSLLLPRFFPL